MTRTDGLLRPAMVIDVHAHCLPLNYLRAVAGPDSVAPPGLTDADGDIEARLAAMDVAGVSRQVLSPAGRGGYSVDEAAAVRAAQVCNDAHHELTRQHPDRFSAYATLPLPHLGASLSELARGLDELGLAGVTIHCSVLDHSVADPAFDPVFAELDARSSVLFLHPCQNGICSPLINDYGFTVAAGAPLEDTVAVLHLMARAIPSRFPNIKIIVPHLGGVIPMLLHRLDNQASKPHLPEMPSATMRRLFYDTVSHGSHAALVCAATALGPTRLLAGSDFPMLAQYEDYGRAFDYVREADLRPDDVDLILRANACQLFGWT